MRFLAVLRPMSLAALLLLSSLVVSLSPFVTSQANAWTAPISQCSNVIPWNVIDDNLRNSINPNSWQAYDTDIEGISFIYGMTTYQSDHAIPFLITNIKNTDYNHQVSSSKLMFDTSTDASHYVHSEGNGTYDATWVLMNDNGTYMTASNNIDTSILEQATCIDRAVNVSYSPTYTGVQYGTGVSKPTYYPATDYYVANYEINANQFGLTDKPNGKAIEGTGYNPNGLICQYNDTALSVRYQLSKPDDDIATDDIIDTQVTNCDGGYKYTTKEYGTYQLSIRLVLFNSHMPFEGDDDVIIGYANHDIRVDGSSYNADPSNTECTVANGVYSCTVADPYENCSALFGEFDLIGGFGCVIKNFGLFLVITARSLVIPSNSNLTRLVNNFRTAVEGQFGFLTTAFTMLKDWLLSLLNFQPDCTVDLGSATFFGARVGYDFCTLERSVPTIYGILMNLARLVIGVSFVFVGYRRLIEVVKGLGR